MEIKDINLLKSTNLERKRMLEEYNSKKELYAKKKQLYTELQSDQRIQKFESIRCHVIHETSLLGFIVKENGTYDRMLNSSNVKSFLDLEKEIYSLEEEIGELKKQLIVKRCLFDINFPAMKIDNCQHELCTMTGILSKNPSYFLRREALNYETQEIELLYDAGFMEGEFFAYRCLDCDLEKTIAVPIECIQEFEATHKIIYGFRYSPQYMQQKYYKLLLTHSFPEAYKILKEEIERGMDYEYLKKTIATRKKVMQKKNTI